MTLNPAADLEGLVLVHDDLDGQLKERIPHVDGVLANQTPVSIGASKRVSRLVAGGTPNGAK